MEKRINLSDINNRHEYNQTTEDQAEELALITDLVDDLITRNFKADGGEQLTTVTDMDNFFQVRRSMSFIECDTPNGWAWPLTEKCLEMTYERSKEVVEAELYRIVTGTIIHRPEITKNPITNCFEIVFYGLKRQSFRSIITQPNLLDSSKPDYVTRPTTPYDHVKLFYDLTDFDQLIETQKQDDERSLYLEMTLRA